MDTNQATTRIHPLMAGAAASVMLVSMVGVAAITGILPNSHSTTAPAPAATLSAPTAAPAVAATAPAQYAATAATAAAEPPVVIHKHVVEHKHVAKRAAPVYSQPVQTARSPDYTQVSAPANQPYQQPAPQPVPQASAPTTGVGIAAGAVLGGLIGNQVGGGRGRTLATVAGAVGGGYVGNEVEKRVRN
jgi:uncharacterized protein YcfJ